MISFTVSGHESVVQTLSAAWQPNQLMAAVDVRTFIAPAGQTIVGLVFDEGFLSGVKTNAIHLEDDEQPAVLCAGVADNLDDATNLNQHVEHPHPLGG